MKNKKKTKMKLVPPAVTKGKRKRIQTTRYEEEVFWESLVKSSSEMGIDTVRKKIQSLSHVAVSDNPVAASSNGDLASSSPSNMERSTSNMEPNSEVPNPLHLLFQFLPREIIMQHIIFK